MEAPNRGRQWRAQRSCASPLHAGLGVAEWKRGGLRKPGATEERGKALRRLRRCADKAVQSRTPPVV